MESILLALIFIGVPVLIILGLKANLYFYRHGALKLAPCWRS
jgi:hypothetical protein